MFSVSSEKSLSLRRMRLVIQRVTEASVEVEGKIIGQIGKGFLVLLGVGKEDTEETARFYLEKMLKLRIFADENGKTNRSLADVSGELLVISQFTLYADCRHGNRPSFTDAGNAETANALYEYFVAECRKQVARVETGEFGADMKVSLVNDGPFTIVLDENLMAGRA